MAGAFLALRGLCRVHLHTLGRAKMRRPLGGTEAQGNLVLCQRSIFRVNDGFFGWIAPGTPGVKRPAFSVTLTNSARVSGLASDE